MLKLKPNLFGGQIESVLKVIREGCPLHGKSRSGVPDCKPCRILQFWDPELTQPVETFSMTGGYVSRPVQ